MKPSPLMIAVLKSLAASPFSRLKAHFAHSEVTAVNLTRPLLSRRAPQPTVATFRALKREGYIEYERGSGNEKVFRISEKGREALTQTQTQ